MAMACAQTQTYNCPVLLISHLLACKKAEVLTQDITKLCIAHWSSATSVVNSLVLTQA